MIFDSNKGIQYIWREDKGDIAVTNTRPSYIFIFCFLYRYTHRKEKRRKDIYILIK